MRHIHTMNIPISEIMHALVINEFNISVQVDYLTTYTKGDRYRVHNTIVLARSTEN